MGVDWATVRAWTGTLGGLSGFASLAWTRWDRWRAVRMASEDRLAAEARMYGAKALVTLTYVPTHPHEGHLAIVEAVTPARLLLVPAVERGGPEYMDGRAYWGTSWIDEGEPRRAIRLSFETTHSDVLRESAIFFASTPSPTVSFSVRVTVTSKARTKRLIRQTIHITPKA